MNTGTVRLLIADDHEMIRLGLRSILESDPRIRVVGEAASPQDAVYQAALLRPDVVLLDVRMPGGSGIDACREILGRNLGSKVIMLTSYADEDAVYESIMAGASGYLLKEINKAGLIDAVIAVSEGRSLLDPEVTRKVLERIRKMAASSDEVARAALSDQEKRVLRLAAHGKTNKQIAADLFLSDPQQAESQLAGAGRRVGDPAWPARRVSGAQGQLTAFGFPPLGERAGWGPATESSATHVLLTERLAPGIGRSAQRGADRRIRGGAGAGYAPRYGPALLMKSGGPHAAR